MTAIRPPRVFRRAAGPTCSALAVAVLAAAMGGTCSTVPIIPGGGGGTAPIILATDHILGASNAAVTVVEYADFQCPFCGQFATQTFPTIKENYVDTGLVRWVFRHFPLTSIHPNAQNAAEASECAHDQNAFWAYHDMLFAHQNDLSDAALKVYAQQIGLASATFDPCLDGNGKTARVQTDVNSGTALGVTGTPTFFIGAARVAGFQSVAQMSALLDAALAAAGG